MLLVRNSTGPFYRTPNVLRFNNPRAVDCAAQTETAEAIERSNKLRDEVWTNQVAEAKASHEAMEKLSKALREELWSKTEAALRVEASARSRVEDTFLPKVERQIQGLEEALRLEHQNGCGMHDQIGRAFDAINQVGEPEQTERRSEIWVLEASSG